MNTYQSQPNSIPSMFNLDYSQTETTFDEILEENSLFLTKEIVKTIFSAMDANEDVRRVGTILMWNDTFDIQVCKDDFRYTLSINLDKLIDFEEYELCAEVKKYMEKLPK